MSFHIDSKIDVQILIRTYAYDRTLHIKGAIDIGDSQTFVLKLVRPGECGWVGMGNRVTRPGTGPCEIDITVEVELDESDESDNPKFQSMESGEVKFDYFGGLEVQWVDFVDAESGDVIVRVYLFELDEE